MRALSRNHERNVAFCVKYMAGETPSAIARQFAVSRNTVARVLCQYGFKGRDRFPTLGYRMNQLPAWLLDNHTAQAEPVGRALR